MLNVGLFLDLKAPGVFSSLNVLRSAGAMRSESRLKDPGIMSHDKLHQRAWDSGFTLAQELFLKDWANYLYRMDTKEQESQTSAPILLDAAAFSALREQFLGALVALKANPDTPKIYVDSYHAFEENEKEQRVKHERRRSSQSRKRSRAKV